MKPKPRSRQSFSRTLGNTAVIAASVVVAAIVLEIGLRTAGYKLKLTADWYLGNETRVPDPDVIITHRYFADPSWYRPQGEGPVIVALGDSFTEGYPAEPVDSYPSMLERILSPFGSTVVNMGQGHSGPGQHLRIFTKFVLPRLQPDIVVWLWYANDVRDASDLPVFEVSRSNELIPLDSSKHWIHRRSRFFDAIPGPLALKRDLVTLALALRAMESQVPQALPTDQTLEKITGIIQAMERLASEQKFELLFVLLAPQAEYLADLNPEWWGDVWMNQDNIRLKEILSSKANYLYAKFDNPYRRSEQSQHGIEVESPDIFAGEERDDQGFGDRHLNERGYQMLAEAIAKALEPKIQSWSDGQGRSDQEATQ